MRLLFASVLLSAVCCVAVAREGPEGHLEVPIQAKEANRQVFSKSDELTDNDPKDTSALTAHSPRKVYTVTLTAGKTYQIDLTSKVFDAFLRLEDPQGRELVANDDALVSGGSDSRIIYRITESGAYRLIATCLTEGRAPKRKVVGKFTLTVVETNAAPPEDSAVLTLDNGGHTAPVRYVFFTPNADRLVSIGWDNVIAVWDVASGRRLRGLRLPPGHELVRGTHGAALSPDGKHLAVACLALDSGPLHIIEVETLRTVFFNPAPIPARAVAFSPKGDRLAYLRGAAVRVRDVSNGFRGEGPQGAGLVVGQHKQATWLAFSPDGKRLASAGPSDVCIWDPAVAKKKKSKGLVELIRLKEDYGTAAGAWSPDGKRLVLSGPGPAGGTRVRFWTIADNAKQQPKIPDRILFQGNWTPKGVTGGGYGFPIFKLHWLATDNRVLATWGHAKAGEVDSGTVQASLINPAGGKSQILYSHHSPDPRKSGVAADVSRDGKLVATSGALRNEIVIWERATGRTVSTLAGRSAPPVRVGWRADSRAIAWALPVNPAAPRMAPLSSGLDLTRLEPINGPELKRFFQAQHKLDDWEVRRSFDGKGRPRDSFLDAFRAGKFVSSLGLGGGRALDFTLVRPPGNEIRVAIATDGDRGLVLKNPATGVRLANNGEFLKPLWDVAASPDGRFLAVASSRNCIGIFTADQLDHLLTVFIARDDWIAWTPQGYYAATPGGERFMGWTVLDARNQAHFLPVERLRKKLYRPDVIKLVLDKGSVAAALKAADAARGTETRSVNVVDLLPPRVSLTVLDQSKLPLVKLNVQAEAFSTAQPITSLRLMVDGRMVPGKGTLIEIKGGKAKVAFVLTLVVPEGDHQFSILARCPDSSAVSAPVRLRGADRKKLPMLHVLAVGVNRYKDSSLDLKFAAADAEALAASFANNCKGQPFRDVKTKVVLNSEATAARIIEELSSLRKQVDQQDLVVIYFACHGVKQKQEYYLLTHEVDLGRLERTSLSGTDLRTSLSTFKCQVLLMLDACHSASFGAAGKLAQLGLKAATDDLTRDLTDDDCGVAVMCAAMSHEKAEGAAGHSLFTQAILEALQKKPGVPFNRQNQRVYVHHLHTFVLDEVSIRSADRQHPFLSLPWVVESFVVR